MKKSGEGGRKRKERKRKEERRWREGGGRNLGFQFFSNLGIINKKIWTSILYKGFSGGSNCKEATYNAEDLSSSPGLGRSPREGNATHSWRIPWTEEPDGYSP